MVSYFNRETRRIWAGWLFAVEYCLLMRQMNFNWAHRALDSLQRWRSRYTEKNKDKRKKTEIRRTKAETTGKGESRRKKSGGRKRARENPLAVGGFPRGTHS